MIRPTPVGPFGAGNGLVGACQHRRTYLIYQANCLTSQASCQRRTTREADLSTQQTGAQAPPWLPRAPRHDRRPQGSCRAPRAWPQAPERLSRAPQRDLIMDRLKQRADFLAVAGGARAATSAFVVQGRRRDDGGPVRIGFTVTKKNGTAPQRNRIRRRLRELVKQLPAISLQPHSDYVLIGRRAALTSGFSNISVRRCIASTGKSRSRARQLKRMTRPDR
jgi:ribonuclease P protein component